MEEVNQFVIIAGFVRDAFEANHANDTVAFKGVDVLVNGVSQKRNPLLDWHNVVVRNGGHKNGSNLGSKG